MSFNAPNNRVSSSKRWTATKYFTAEQVDHCPSGNSEQPLMVDWGSETVLRSGALATAWTSKLDHPISVYECSVTEATHLRCFLIVIAPIMPILEFSCGSAKNKKKSAVSNRCRLKFPIEVFG